MSSLAFLVTELQSLASESRRKHPEIREAAEKSLAILRSSPEQAIASLASDGAQSDDLLRPVFMGCATKNAKVVAISLGSLQRLIALKAVPKSAVPLIISTMSDAMSQGVDIQLRILQTLVSLITNFPSVHGDLLGEALLLCFKLQDSRIAVVSSTAAATLRQLVMFVFDKMVDEDRRNATPADAVSEITLPNGSTASLGPYATDAYSVFEDLCLLANMERPHFLHLEYLHKTFALELIESVLTNYHELFRQHSELLLLLQHHLCPLLLKSLSERAVFPLTLRCFRVVFLLLKKFSFELKTEAEVFFMLLIKIVSEDLESSTLDHAEARPPWMRVLAMEIMRGLCSDAELIRNIWDRYDARQSGAKVFTCLISALKRLVTEKPALLGVCTQMSGVGVYSHSTEGASGSSSASGYGLDVGGVAGIVATAASATVSGVVGMIGSGSGLSIQQSGMKLQCIDQLDKADSPPIPETYIYLLAVQCIVSLCEGFASFTGPLYTSIMVQRPRTAGESIIHAPPALDMSLLPPDEPATIHLGIVRAMVEHGWPALLAALSFIISTNLSDELFVDVLTGYQAMANVAGMLSLTTPRDAFFTSLSKFAVPSRVVSSLESYIEPHTPRSSTLLTDNLGLTVPPVPPGLSERNLVCLKVLISSALFLAGSLGESWYSILEAVQNADYVLTLKGSQLPSSRRNSTVPGAAGTASRVPSGTGVPESAKVPSQPPRHPLLVDTDPESIQLAIQRLFEASKILEDSAFQDFVRALCRLSSEMVGMQSDTNEIVNGESDGPEELLNPGGLSPRVGLAHRRRVSGIHLPRTLRSGDFGIERLGVVAMLNIHRLIYRSPEIAWDPMTTHLLSIISLVSAPPAIRVQAARVLDECLVVIPRNLSPNQELQAKVQRRVLDVLAKQTISPPADGIYNTSTNLELRRMGLETLHLILQASGHTLVVGWETIFEMLGSVCKPAMLSRADSIDSVSTISLHDINRPKPLPLGYNNERGHTTLVKIAFQSMKLVCDSVSTLSPEHLRLCIATLGQFGRQAETNVALTAAESLLWSVSDSIQAKRRDALIEPSYSELWMFLLLEMLGLCTDARPEIRVGAIQTLFRAMQLYGATLSLDTWNDCMWKITFPLLDSISVQTRCVPPDPAVLSMGETPEQAWDESKSLSLQWIGTIISEFLVSKIIRLQTFIDAWKVFVSHIKDTILLDRRPLSLPALQCLEKAVDSLLAVGGDLQAQVTEAWEYVWQACNDIGTAIAQGGRLFLSLQRNASTVHRPFTQDSLVAFTKVIRTTRRVSWQQTHTEWPLERLTRLMEILKGVVTYSSSPDYRPDIDGLTPLQASVLETAESIELTAPGVPSLVIRDLSEYVTLPFLAAFHPDQTDASVPGTPVTPVPASARKQVTYIGLSKKAMPSLVELYLRFRDHTEMYEDGTLEAVLSAYSIPMKLKYDCPSPSKFGKDPPLWKTATTCFLRIVTECAGNVSRLGQAISNARVEAIWRRVIEGFRGGILADCSAAETLSVEEQEAEENFDLALISSLEVDLVPHLGNPRVPDYLIVQLAKVLHKGSQLLQNSSMISSGLEDDDRITDSAHTSLDSYEHQISNIQSLGSTTVGSAVLRERFSFWCLDLLFLICSNVTSDHAESRRRVAALCLPSLLDRCQTAMVSYIADEALRGSLPFPRVREDELLHILRKLLKLKLWPGTFWAAFSDAPTKYSSVQPPVDPSLPASALIPDIVRRSSVAHLYHFYTIMCELSSIPRQTPSAWILSPPPTPASSTHSRAPEDKGILPNPSVSNVNVIRNEVTIIDARGLARECLKVLGTELGAI
ncbi:hypothetical protein EDD16DRAFT_1822615 [Pisolithus croceorrhizus]|nr:hypothetical protein EDD16DRAFT_1822615 [Pisolithus croceorrhizus]